MAKNDWSTTASDNDNADLNINWLEGQAAATINNSARAQMAAEAAWLEATAGALTTGGSDGVAYTLTTNDTTTANGIAAYSTGILFLVKFNVASTSVSANIDIDQLGAKNLKAWDGTALPSTTYIAANDYVFLKYDGTNMRIFIPQTSVTGTSGHAIPFLDGTNTWSGVNTFSDNISMGSTKTVDGRDVSVDGTKLDGIATGATADTGASDTEVLTATDSVKFATPQAILGLWGKGGNVASATPTLDVGGLFHITGTTTITDIDFTTPKDGRMAVLIFDEALTLTHHSTTLKLPGAANITTAAGDRAIIVQDSGDNIVVVDYIRAASAPLSYEASTFVPVLTFATDPGNLDVEYAASGRIGRYTKIGNRVFYTVYILTTTFTHTTATGDLRITGFPYTALTSTGASSTACALGGYTNAAYTQISGYVVGNNTYAQFRGSGSGTAIAIVDKADMPTGGTVEIYFSGHYETAS